MWIAVSTLNENMHKPMSHNNVEGYLHVVHDPIVFAVMWQTYMTFNVMQCIRKSALWTDKLCK